MLVVSIVSHNHGMMVWNLVNEVLSCPEVNKIIITLNIPEKIPDFINSKIDLIVNPIPKGFGANHNAAFQSCRSDYFCVMNPDIQMIDNPFTFMMERFKDNNVGLVAPLVLAQDRAPEDSMRRFLTPWAIVKRTLKRDSGAYDLIQGGNDVTPDWVAGMFMLFRSDVYKKIEGFDERYFMYCEDVDICTRLWLAGYIIIGCLSVSVIHNAQRNSHRSLIHFKWHMTSIIRYLLLHSFRLPNTKQLQNIQKTLMSL